MLGWFTSFITSTSRYTLARLVGSSWDLSIILMATLENKSQPQGFSGLTYLCLGNSVPGQFHHGEIPPTNRCLNLIESNSKRRAVRGADISERWAWSWSRHPVLVLLTAGLAHNHLPSLLRTNKLEIQHSSQWGALGTLALHHLPFYVNVSLINKLFLHTVYTLCKYIESS